MKVRELISILGAYNPEHDVVFMVDYETEVDVLSVYTVTDERCIGCHDKVYIDIGGDEDFIDGDGVEVEDEEDDTPLGMC